MRKIILLGTIIILLLVSGCARLDPYIEKVPFFSHEKEGKDLQEDENDQLVKKEEPALDPQQDTEQDENPSSDSSDSNNDVTEEQEENWITLDEIFFNEIKEMNGQKIIQNPENSMALVNKQFGLPETFLPDDLTRPKVDFSFGNKKLEKSMLRRQAAVALESMFAEAKLNSIELFAVSGYRSYAYQDLLFAAEVKKVGKEKAIAAVAFPGQSEHQTGLAMDISSRGEGMLLTEAFGDTKEGIWLADNAHRFGFILRYPKGKESITGYQYEPWHFRYIGIEAATIIYEKKWTLEEYFNLVKKI